MCTPCSKKHLAIDDHDYELLTFVREASRTTNYIAMFANRTAMGAAIVHALHIHALLQASSIHQYTLSGILHAAQFFAGATVGNLKSRVRQCRLKTPQ